ncbi:MAG: GH92 family glycosyl hydrolase [Pyrinomonas methylaliphatogenes]|jgi:predicted alpha-1,2-mannosidase|nr:GH92 family glycosyl hydrolase [Pyrinomonas methylaliphatogenes]
MVRTGGHRRLIGSFLLFAFASLLTQSALAQRRTAKLVDYVNPFIGTGGHGHTYPGAVLPFGMVQLSPDTRVTGWDSCSGYHYSDDVIYGFSHTHLSGTGVPDYNDILFAPTVGEAYLEPKTGEDAMRGYASHFSHRNEVARPGYYAVLLDDEKIKVELTATMRVGLHRYTFPDTDRANIIVDLRHRDKVLDSMLRVVGPARIEGYRRSQSWARDQIVYFVAEFSKPFKEFGIALDGRILAGAREARGADVRAFFRFDARHDEPILVRVAISAVDLDGARRNLAAELNHWDFERVRRDAERAWERELSRIIVRGGTREQLIDFYTAMYHLMLAPNVFMDVDGRYRGRDFKIHTARDYTHYTVFSLWDTFRAAHPLFTIIDQKRTRDFIRTFLAQYEQVGRLPVWELAANETDTMIGYHAVSVIADAAVKGIAGFDWEEAFEAMKQSAERDARGLAAYRQRGYVAIEDDRESVSKTLEYAYDDWCIAQMARLLGRDDDHRRYLERARYYRNLFDRETGFMRPRKRDGSWLTPFDPREVSAHYTEANAWQYTFFVPQDIGGLIELMGGPERFELKLDELFTTESKLTGRELPDITGLIGQYAHGNEPSHHIAYLYDYVGRPWKAQARVHQIMTELYKPTPDGLSGNEDCGQMSAWYIFSAAGFYPVTPGSKTYAIGSPLFEEVTFNLENGRRFTIRARNVSARRIYIRSATLNGRPYSRPFITHDDLMRGGTLVLTMSDRPSRWGTKEAPFSRIERP